MGLTATNFVLAGATIVMAIAKFRLWNAFASPTRYPFADVLLLCAACGKEIAMRGGRKIK